MTRALTARDRIVRAAEANGFAAHGLHVVIGSDAVVTITADDHAGADAMAEHVVRTLRA